ncbi:MAG: copper resistance protein NlpE [Pseudomonadota bacterium]|nr:copper resistance protein NlpE [Pseudomonadota bacterium]
MKFRLLHATLLTLLLSACESGPSQHGPDQEVETASTGIEFRGERACVDCVGIRTWLRLEAEGEAQSYRLVEEYFGHDGVRRFDDHGNWVSKNEILRLRSIEGGERVYARLPDGRLQARGSRGEVLPAVEGDVMTPVTFDSAR